MSIGFNSKRSLILTDISSLSLTKTLSLTILILSDITSCVSSRRFMVSSIEEEKDGFLFGWTDNYVRVTHPFVENLVNRIVPVKLEKLNQDKMDGIIAINDLVSA